MVEHFYENRYRLIIFAKKTLPLMFDWVLNMPQFVKNKEANYLISKLKIVWPILWMGYNCLKATEPPWGDSLHFATQSPGIPSTPGPQKNERMSWPLNHPGFFNLGLLDWEPSTLTTTIIWKMHVKCKCRVFYK